MSFLSQLEWRFATKKFDPSKRVSSENLEKILTAIRMAPSSYGLQPYHVLVITNPELRIKLREKSFGQPQVTDASHLLVFCTRTDGMERIDRYVELASGGDSDKAESLQGYAEIMRNDVGKKSPEQFKSWADRQTYIALGFALAACAELEIDSTPMEGFEPKAFDDLLKLPDYLKTVVLLPIGYRAEDPTRNKIRFSKEALFT